MLRNATKDVAKQNAKKKDPLPPAESVIIEEGDGISSSPPPPPQAEARRISGRLHPGESLIPASTSTQPAARRVAAAVANIEEGGRVRAPTFTSQNADTSLLRTKLHEISPAIRAAVEISMQEARAAVERSSPAAKLQQSLDLYRVLEAQQIQITQFSALQEERDTQALRVKADFERRLALQQDSMQEQAARYRDLDQFARSLSQNLEIQHQEQRNLRDIVQQSPRAPAPPHEVIQIHSQSQGRRASQPIMVYTQMPPQQRSASPEVMLGGRASQPIVVYTQMAPQQQRSASPPNSTYMISSSMSQSQSSPPRNLLPPASPSRSNKSASYQNSHCSNVSGDEDGGYDEDQVPSDTDPEQPKRPAEAGWQSVIAQAAQTRRNMEAHNEGLHLEDPIADCPLCHPSESQEQPRGQQQVSQSQAKAIKRSNLEAPPRGGEVLQQVVVSDKINPETARQLAIINAANKELERLKALEQSGPPKLTIRVRKESARDKEKKMAELTGDQELLKTKSRRIVAEKLSDDDETEVRRELAPSIVHHNLFHLKNRERERTRQGYVRSDHVTDDHDSDADEDSTQADEDGEGESDPDWEPSDTPTPSPSRGAWSKAVSKTDFKAFKAWQKQHGNSAQQAPAPSDEPASRDQHGRLAAGVIPQYNFNVATAPVHGKWNDIHYLMNTFKDKHTKYVSQCRGGGHDSVWECYDETAKDKLIEHLGTKTTVKGSAATIIKRDALYMSRLTDTALYALLCDELGIDFPMEVERQLKLAKFEGSAVERESWVDFVVEWRKVLKRVTDPGTVQPRRLTELFREQIPDPFIREWLKGRKYASWRDAYEGIVEALEDSNWKNHYIKDLLERQAESKKEQAGGKAGGKGNAGGNAGGGNTGGGNAGGGNANSNDRHKSTAPVSQDVFSFKVGKFSNVNPNFKQDLNHNPERKTCSRCQEVHRYKDADCTSGKTKEGAVLTSLPSDEYKKRMERRWNDGFFAAKPLIESKSVTEAASDATRATKAIS